MFGMVILNNIWPGVLVIVGARMLYKALKGSKQKLNNQK
jgi:putative Mn2+ efflux pump MntP